ncbi:MAG: hypothetical protein P1P80_00440 [ANME-2 cluster archaeon]|nr:hypothetical protein [ANME-2 cluster archaeon]
MKRIFKTKDGAMNFLNVRKEYWIENISKKSVTPKDLTTTGFPDFYIPPGQTLGGMIVNKSGETIYEEVYSETLLAYGGTPLSEYTWTRASGFAFPPGTTVDAQTGIFHSSGGKLLPRNS